MRVASVTASKAAEIYARDHQLLIDVLDSVPRARRAAPYPVIYAEFCETLNDLTFHIAMWDEITLAVILEARRGRRHWSLEAMWETSKAGESLNQGGVAASRHLTDDLLRHRLGTVANALETELLDMDDDAWGRPMDSIGFGGTLGALVEYVATPPTGGIFGHCRRHLIAGDSAQPVENEPAGVTPPIS